MVEKDRPSVSRRFINPMRDGSESKAKFLLIAATPVVALFFIIPFELYYNAREYWNWNFFVPLGFAALGAALYLVLAVALQVLFRINDRLASYASSLLFLVGLFVLLSDVLSPLQTTLLDGRELTSTEPIQFTLLEAGIFIFVFIGPLFFGIRKMLSAATSVSGMLIIISFVYLGIILASSKPASSVAGAVSAQDIKGNVYHILLDEMQTDAAEYLEKSGLDENFDGFTLFKHNTSNYLYTSASVPSFLTGTLYNGREESFGEWKEGFRRRGLLKKLSEKGYVITMYSPRHNWTSPFVSEFITLDDIYEETTGIKDSQYGDFVQIWFARITPNILTNEALVAGKKLGRFVYGFIGFDSNAKKIPVTIAEGKEPFSSVSMLKKVIYSEKAKPADGRYIYAHAIIPHGPYVFNENCVYEPGLREKGTEGYLAQVECAFGLVAEFIEELKRLGRYDSSTIIIHADTGHGHRGFIGSGTGGLAPGLPYLNNNLGWTVEQVRARIKALLMIKPANSTGILKISERPSQLVDLYPTMIDLLALGEDVNTDGFYLFANSFPGNRKASFFLFPPEENDPGDIIKVEVDDQKNLQKSRLTVAGYIKKYGSKRLLGSLTFDIGGTEDEGLQLAGFSNKESSLDGALKFRWAMGGKSRMVFRGIELPETNLIRVTFEVEPFVVNENKEMTIRTSLSTASVKLKHGWSKYAVELNFPKGEDPAIDIHYEDSASPKSMGINEDKRDLAVRWKRIVFNGMEGREKR